MHPLANGHYCSGKLEILRVFARLRKDISEKSVSRDFNTLYYNKLYTVYNPWIALKLMSWVTIKYAYYKELKIYYIHETKNKVML